MFRAEDVFTDEAIVEGTGDVFLGNTDGVQPVGDLGSVISAQNSAGDLRSRGSDNSGGNNDGLGEFTGSSNGGNVLLLGFVGNDVVSTVKSFAFIASVESSAGEDDASENTSDQTDAHGDEVGGNLVGSSLVIRGVEVGEFGSVETIAGIGDGDGDEGTNSSNEGSNKVEAEGVRGVTDSAGGSTLSDELDEDDNEGASNKANTSSDSRAIHGSHTRAHDNTTGNSTVADFSGIEATVVEDDGEGVGSEGSSSHGEVSVDDDLVLEGLGIQGSVERGEEGEEEEGTNEGGKVGGGGGDLALFVFNRELLVEESKETKTVETTESEDEQMVVVGGDVQLVEEDVLVDTVGNDFNAEDPDHLDVGDLSENNAGSDEDSDGGVASLDEVDDFEVVVSGPVVRVDAVPEFNNEETPLESNSGDGKGVENSGEGTSASEGEEVTVTDDGHGEDVSVVKVNSGVDGGSAKVSITTVSVRTDSSVDDQESDVEEKEEEEVSLLQFVRRTSGGSHFD